MSDQNKAIVRRFIDEVYNRGNLDFVDEIVGSDFVRHGIGGTVQGGQFIKDRAAAVRSGFPDFHITIEDQLADGDKVIVRQTHTGTHQGDFMGIAPTGNTIETTEISILRLADGKIREVWVNVDLFSLLQQIDALPPPGG